MSLHLAPEGLCLVQIGAWVSPQSLCVVPIEREGTGVLRSGNSGAVLSKEPYTDALCRFISFSRDNDRFAETE